MEELDVVDVEERVRLVIADRSGRKAVRLLSGLRHSSAPSARLRVTWNMKKRSKRRSDEGSARHSGGASLGLKTALPASSDESVLVTLRFKHNISNISPTPAPTPAQKGSPSDGGDQGHIPQSVPLFELNEQPSTPEDGDQGHIPQSVPPFDLNELPSTPEDGVSDS